VSKQEVKDYPATSRIDEAIRRYRPNLFVISNPTSAHLETLRQVRAQGFSGPVLVEKPLALSGRDLNDRSPHPTFVGYNLRFHPVVQALKESLAGKRSLSAHFYVGQDLSSWRPNRDYRLTYSADPQQGGGVLRDLSHELDLLVHILGPIRRVVALVGRRSKLDIGSEDIACILLETVTGCFVTLEMNYIDKRSARTINVNCDDETFFGDLISGTLSTNQKRLLFDVNRDLTYKRQLEDLLGPQKILCSFDEGKYVVQLIDKIEQSVKEETWIVV